MIEGATAAIVAGGQGRRLGRADKWLLEVGGRAILDRQLDVLQPLFAEIVAVTDRPEAFASRGIRCVPDVLPGKGAPGGIHAALLAAGNEWVFALAGDMPFVGAQPIVLLAEQRGAFDAVVPYKTGNGLTGQGSAGCEGLHAFYRRTCLSPFETLLEQGNPSVTDLVASVNAKRIAAEDLDPSRQFLANINDPGDLRLYGLP